MRAAHCPGDQGQALNTARGEFQITQSDNNLYLYLHLQIPFTVFSTKYLWLTRSTRSKVVIQTAATQENPIVDTCIEC